jgi:hypothetical protein
MIFWSLKGLAYYSVCSPLKLNSLTRYGGAHLKSQLMGSLRWEESLDPMNSRPAWLTQ